MPALLIDGKALAQKTREKVAQDVAGLSDQAGIVPGLSVVLVGDDPASRVYVGNKQKASKAAGMTGDVIRGCRRTIGPGRAAVDDRPARTPTRPCTASLSRCPCPATSTSAR